MYRERFGNADGMTFVLVGSFEIAGMKPLVARFLGGLPASPRPSRFRDVGLRYPTGDIDRTLEAGSDNSALSIVYSGERPYSLAEKSGSTRLPRCCGCGWSIAFARSSEARTPRAS